MSSDAPRTPLFDRPLTHLCFSPDGAFLACAAAEGVALVEAATAQPRHLWPASCHDDVLALAFAAGPPLLLVTASADAGVRLHDVASGAAILCKGHTDAVVAIAIDPGRARIATSSLDGTVRAWSLPDGAPLAVLRGHREGARGAIFDADGTLLTVAGDGTRRRFGRDLSTEEARFPPEKKQPLLDEAARVEGCPQGVVTLSAERPNVVLYSPATGEALWRLPGSDLVAPPTLDPEGERVLCMTPEGALTIVGIGGKKLAQLPQASAGFALHRDHVATWGSGVLSLWDLTKRKVRAVLDDFDDDVTVGASTPAGTGKSLLALGLGGGGLRVVDWRALLARPPAPRPAPRCRLTCLGRHPDVTTYAVLPARAEAVLASGGSLHWVRSSDGAKLRTVSLTGAKPGPSEAGGDDPHAADSYGAVMELRVVAGRLCVRTGLGLRLLHGESGEELHALAPAGHTGALVPLGEQRVALAGEGPADARFYDVLDVADARGWRVALPPGAQPWQPRRPNPCGALLFSSDTAGTHLVAYDAATGSVRAEVPFRKARGNDDFSVSPDGTRLLTAMASGEVTLYDLPTGQRLLHRQLTPDGSPPCLSPSFRWLWLEEQPGKILLIDTRDGMPRRRFKLPLAFLGALGTDPGETRWLFHDGDRVALVELERGQVTCFTGSEGAWSPDGSRFALVDWRAKCLLHLADGRRAGLAFLPRPCRVHWAPGGRALAVSESTGGDGGVHYAVHLLDGEGAVLGKVVDPGTGLQADEGVFLDGDHYLAARQGAVTCWRLDP